MGRGGKINSRGDVKRRLRSKDKGSDDSDEDYVVSDEGNDVSEDELEDYCSSLDGYASEESFNGFVEEEEEVEEKKEARKVIGLKEKSSHLGNRDKTSRKRKRVLYGDEEDEDYEGEEEEEEDEDEEFTPDEDDSLDDEEELVFTKKNTSWKNKKLGRKGLRKKSSVRGQKRRKQTASAKPSGKKGRRTQGLRRKERCYDDEDGDFLDDAPAVGEKSKTKSSWRRRKYVVRSDSDFVSSESSDYDDTISEEEREQVREANELCGNRKTSLRSSFPLKKIEENNSQLQRKPPARKGKEKMEVVKSEVAKQVCGICLSEEDKRRFRGTLNCCNHFFCFTCIMEWSKVESRCPLCKQRFKTITKPERAAAGVDLRSMVIQVPKRDQVYQPSEEDLRSYIDPYENVICSECHLGGDDGLMLLCDICDSSAHTYCVGLGLVVPEGNWYCDVCRPVAPGSSSSLARDPLPDQRTTNNNLFNRPSPILSSGERLEPSSLPSPCVLSTQGSVNLSSPRVSVGDVQVASPGSGAGAPTLSGRRWIHRQIQNLLSINRMNFMAGSVDGMPTPNLSSDILNSQIEQSRETIVQQASLSGNTELLHQTPTEERLHEYPSSLAENSGFFFSRLSHLRRQVVQDPTMITMSRPANLTLWPELAGINSIPSYEQFRQCGTISHIGSDGVLSLFPAKDEGDFYVAKEQLQSIVKSHLKNLSTDIELDVSASKDIARSSTHTILAACGLEHRRSEVHFVHPPSICSHVERLAAGQTSLMKGFCSSCFDTFVKDVVKRIMDTRMQQWLSLGL